MIEERLLNFSVDGKPHKKLDPKLVIAPFQNSKIPKLNVPTDIQSFSWNSELPPTNSAFTQTSNSNSKKEYITSPISVRVSTSPNASTPSSSLSDELTNPIAQSTHCGDNSTPKVPTHPKTLSLPNITSESSTKFQQVESLRSIQMFPGVSFEDLLKSEHEQYITHESLCQALRTEPSDFSVGDYYDIILKRGISDPDVNRSRSEFLRKRLYNTKVNSQVPLVNSEVTALKFHTSLNPTIFAGDLSGRLGILSVNLSTGEETRALIEVNDSKVSKFGSGKGTASDRITKIENHSLEHDKIFTSSSGGRFDYIDLNHLKPMVQFQVNEAHGITDMHCYENLVYYSNTNGDVGIIDIRQNSNGTNKSMISNVQQEPITGFSVSPHNNNWIAFVSPERNVKIWDMRYNNGPERSTLVGSDMQTPGNCDSISWNIDNQILTTCATANTVSILNINLHSVSPFQSKQTTQVFPMINIRHNLNVTNHAMTPITTQWQRSPNDQIQKFTIPNLSQYSATTQNQSDNYFIDVFDSHGNQLANLSDWRIGSPVVSTAVHDSENFTAAGISSGRVYLFI
ncbi:hypothetical protein WICPIJ_004705 [Wickerhamomyces pijperi]|uniref:DNA damage-binding protein CMR1 n=1 Tax=Wickerhamomyces pijperi TaxID=599730 RepID=A0A9P8Q7D9_WICPI|nr:hypothetical protein WICPIJ_004705 [Wickerhamomyces pijperi]